MSRYSFTLEDLRACRDPKNIGRESFDKHLIQRTRTGWVVVTHQHSFGQNGVEWLCEPSHLRRYFKDRGAAEAELAKRYA